MFSKKIKYTAIIVAALAGIMMIPLSAKADNEAVITGYTESGILRYAAGAHVVIGEMVARNDIVDTGVSQNDTPLVAEPEEETEYSNMAVAQVDEYLNIRVQPDETSEVLGKLYNNGVATVLEVLDGWYKVTSGSVTGYVSADYVVVGDETLCREVSKKIGTITAGALKFREKPSLDAPVLTFLIYGAKVEVLDDSVIGWYQITNGNYTGFASADFIDVTTICQYAESKEEEAQRLAAEEEARRLEEIRRWEAEQKRQQTLKERQQAAANKTYLPPSGANGQAVADYACQFIGNPYVWGGSSLIYGTDCSGFVKLIYAEFGFDLPRNSYGLRSAGYAVSVAEMMPGDIVCYSGHVGIYIGNGKIVHASGEKDGVKISNYAYSTVLAVRRVY